MCLDDVQCLLIGGFGGNIVGLAELCIRKQHQCLGELQGIPPGLLTRRGDEPLGCLDRGVPIALVDLRPLGITGEDADEALERASITCNKNGVPFDPLPPVKTSGIRVGSPAGTTRGFGIQEFRAIADMVADVLEGVRANGEAGDSAVEAQVKARVRELCARFPIYPEL